MKERAVKYDQQASFPFENFADFRTNGLLTVSIPTRYGGLGASYADYVRVSEEVGRHCGATGLTFNMHNATMLWCGEVADMLDMTPEQRERHDREIDVAMTGSNIGDHLLVARRVGTVEMDHIHRETAVTQPRCGLLTLLEVATGQHHRLGHLHRDAVEAEHDARALEERVDERDAARLAAQRPGADALEHGELVELVALELRDDATSRVHAVVVDGVDEEPPDALDALEVVHRLGAEHARQRVERDGEDERDAARRAVGELDDHLDAGAARNHLAIAEGPVGPTARSRAGRAHVGAPENDGEVVRERPGRQVLQRGSDRLERLGHGGCFLTPTAPLALGHPASPARSRAVSCTPSNRYCSSSIISFSSDSLSFSRFLR